MHQALLKDSDRCTVLLIAQKMSSVEKASHIVVLKEGEVYEEGSHDELMKNGGFYAELVTKQNIGFQRKEEGKEIGNA